MNQYPPNEGRLRVVLPSKGTVIKPDVAAWKRQSGRVVEIATAGTAEVINFSSGVEMTDFEREKSRALKNIWEEFEYEQGHYFRAMEHRLKVLEQTFAQMKVHDLFLGSFLMQSNQTL